jgi:site-specific DNA-cytosine methylase
VAATLNSGGNNGGFRTEPGEHLAVVGFSENQRGEVLTHRTAHQLTGGGGKPGQGYSAAIGPFTAGDSELLPLGLDSHRYRCCGNGVVSNVAESIGRALLSVIEQDAAA